MSQLHLSDEILMAFADGELDEAVAAAVERAMLSDPTITKKIAGFLRSRRLARSAFSSNATLDVSPELRNAVLARISAFEIGEGGAAQSTSHKDEGASGGINWRTMGFSLAASVAAIAFAAAGYLIGQQDGAWQGAPSLVSRLDDPAVQNTLSRSPSGQDQELSVGRMRVVSTYRLTSGSLCREFRLQASSGIADAVACRTDRWNVTFMLTSAPSDAAYVPSDGVSLKAAYLQSVGSGDPLVDAAEVQALNEANR